MANDNQVAVVQNGIVYILQAGTPVFVKTADICTMTGKSNQWIGQLKSQGDLNAKKTKYGPMYELLPNMKAYCAKLETRSGDKDEEDRKTEKERKKWETSIKKSKATMEALKTKEILGKMHRSEDVAAMTEDLIYTIRGALLALPGRLAVATANAKDATEASNIITQEIYAIMEDLSNYKYDAGKYAERVQERLNMDSLATEDGDE